MQIISPPDLVVVKVIQYTGNAANPRSHVGIGFQSTRVEIWPGSSNSAESQSPIYVNTGDATSMVYDVAVTCWRATNTGEHLTIDSNGFTTTSLGNDNNIKYTAICYK